MPQSCPCFHHIKFSKTKPHLKKSAIPTKNYRKTKGRTYRVWGNCMVVQQTVADNGQQCSLCNTVTSQDSVGNFLYKNTKNPRTRDQSHPPITSIT